MKIKKSKKKNIYLVESTSKKGRFYEVDIKKPFCTCPDFMFRELKRHGICKHIKAAKEYNEGKSLKERAFKELVTAETQKGVGLKRGEDRKIKERKKEAREKGVKKIKEEKIKKEKTISKISPKSEKLLKELSKGPLDSVEAIEKYGEEAIEDLKRRGEIIEKEGKVMLL
ncbi:MAG: SWIM zinc finger domain-containing protein [Candidatus Woesearchaeota archaeon]|nr:SWIM zinc finger domain-containing protein [Candidatus Woesearchaeota archaeon]